MKSHVFTCESAIGALIRGVVAFGLIATSLPAYAAELKPMAGQSVDLGAFHGVVYYTGEGDEYRVVATMADGRNGEVIRVSTALADNQSASISMPAEAGKAAPSLEISRAGNKVFLVAPGDATVITD